MRLSFITSFGLLLAASQAFGQGVVGQFRYATSGPLELTVIASTSDKLGNLYTLSESGTNAPNAVGQVVTQKFNSAGLLQWSDFYSLPPDSELTPTSIVVGTAGGVAIGGKATNLVTGATGIFVRSLSAQGSAYWATVDETSSSVQGLQMDSSGNPIVAEGLPNGNLVLVKYLAAVKTVLWHVPQTVTGSAFFQAFAADASNNVYGLIQTSSESEVIKYNTQTGDPIWKVTYAMGGTTNFTPQYLLVTPSGDAVVSGIAFHNPAVFSVARVDRLKSTNGTFVFQKSLGSQLDEAFATMLGAPVSDATSNIYVPYHDISAITATNTLGVLKLSSAGAVLYTSPLTSTATAVTLATGVSGDLFEMLGLGPIPKTLQHISSTGTVLWSEFGDLHLTGSGPAIYVDASNNLTYLGSSISALGERRVGLEKFNGTTHATVFDLTPSTTGIMDSGFASVAGHDASGNSYVVGTENNNVFAAKLGPTGSVLWKTDVAPTSSYFLSPSYCRASVSSEGVALVVRAGYGVGVAKLSLTGQVLWSNGFQPANWAITYPYKIFLDPSGNVDLGLAVFNTPNVLMMDQFASGTGSMTWSKSFNVGSTLGQIALDSAGDVYGVGAPVSGKGWYLAKVSAAGTTLFSKAESAGSTAFNSPTIDFDATSGHVFLAGGDLVTDSNNVKQGTLQVGCYDASGNELWEKPVTLTGYQNLSGIELSHNDGLGAVVAEYQGILASGSQPTSTFVTALKAASGSASWTNQLNIPDSTGQTNAFAFDADNNIVVAGTAGFNVQNDVQAFIWRLSSASGATQFNATNLGNYTSQFSSINGLTIGPDNRPIVFGSAPSATGPGSLNSIMVKVAFGPFAVNDSFTVKKNTTLSNASVAANDQDVTGATFTVVKNPTHAASFTLTSAGILTYTPAANFTGTDTLTYEAKNAYGSTQATVTITVN